MIFTSGGFEGGGDGGEETEEGRRRQGLLNAYCHGEWVPLVERQGWWFCPSCDTALWRVGSVYGRDEEKARNEEARAEGSAGTDAGAATVSGAA